MTESAKNMGKESTRNNRVSLYDSIGEYIRRNQIFYKDCTKYIWIERI